jgi:hypothetical protein
MNRRRQAGIVLIDCMVYIATFFVVVTLAFGALHRAWNAHRSIKRSAEDIAAAVRAGEQWRADLRGASGPLELEEQAGATWLRVPRGEGLIVYAFYQGTVYRFTSEHPAPVPMVRHVAQSGMMPDPRSGVTPWRWELELKPSHAKARLRPLFTFLAVPPASKP